MDDVVVDRHELQAPSRLAIPEGWPIIESRPNVIGLSCFAWTLSRQLQLASLCKHALPDVPIVLGGPQATASFDLLLREQACVDAVVVGEGERALADLLRHWTAHKGLDGGAPDWPEGVAGRSGTAIRYAPRQCLADLGDLASPILDGTLTVPRGTPFPWELARGCSFQCAYCFEAAGSGRTRLKPLELVEEELRVLCSMDGLQSVWGLIPTFNANPAYALELLRLIRKNNTRRLAFYFEAKIDLYHEELLSAIAGDPCIRVSFGLQSTNPRTLEEIGRPLRYDLAVKTAGVLSRRSATYFSLDLMVGLPHDTNETLRRTIDESAALRPHKLKTFPVSILPGTKLAQRADALGLVFDPTPDYLVTRTPELTTSDLRYWWQVGWVMQYWNTSHHWALLAGLRETYAISPAHVLEECARLIFDDPDKELKAFVERQTGPEAQWTWCRRSGLQIQGRELDLASKVVSIMHTSLANTLADRAASREGRRVLELLRFCCDRHSVLQPFIAVANDEVERSWRAAHDGTRRLVWLSSRLQHYAVGMEEWLADRTTPLDRVVGQAGASYACIGPHETRLLPKGLYHWLGLFRIPTSVDEALRRLRRTHSVGREVAGKLEQAVTDAIARRHMRVVSSPRA